MFAEIILPLNIKGTFTYKIPNDLQPFISLGMRVLVPFGGRKIYTGIVANIHNQQPELFVPKEIVNILDDTPILPLEQLRFWNWLSEYYLCNIGEIYRYAFPASLKLESETYLKLKPNAEIDYQILDVNEIYLIQALEVKQIINLSEIEAFIPKKEIIKTISSLINLQYIEIDEHIAEKYKTKEVAFVRIKNLEGISAQLPQILLSLKKAPKQQELFLLLLEKQTENKDKNIRKSDLLDEGNFAPAQLKSLVEKGLVEEFYQEQNRLPTYKGKMEEVERLTEAQQEAKNKIDKAFAEKQNVLLHGVTSSGKTHIYLQKIEETIAEGKNVFLLLPEIALTKQMTQRLEKKYGEKLGFYHQKLTDFERVEVWRKVRKNQLKIVVGTRGALFLPFQDLGLIVVDEEHDSAYRPRDISPSFNAKDSALVLARFYDAKVILGSATPSLESWFATQKGRLAYVPIEERFGQVDLPKIQLINYKEAQDRKEIVGNFSQQLLDELEHQKNVHKQSIILHNRRGYSNVVECENCGFVHYCSNCDVVMTYHKSSNEMKCHYCGQKTSKPSACPKCNSEKLNARGVGVEQIHEEIAKIFPKAEVDRMDVDSMRRKFAYEKLYEKIENGETDIIVGTQMISKGLDFDAIELVGIPRADQMIYIQDFRAEEKAYQLITQVSGRAGRASGKGKILIQTYNPSHSIFSLIKENNPQHIYQYLLEERRKFNYPPYTKLIMIELKHRKEDKVQRASQFLGSILRKYLPAECVLGPEKSPIARVNTLYQFQIMLKLPRGKKYEDFKKYVLTSLEEFQEVKAYQSIKCMVCVDY